MHLHFSSSWSTPRDDKMTPSPPYRESRWEERAARPGGLARLGAVGLCAGDDPGDIDQAGGRRQLGVGLRRVRVGVAVQVACTPPTGALPLGFVHRFVLDSALGCTSTRTVLRPIGPVLTTLFAPARRAALHGAPMTHSRAAPRARFGRVASSVSSNSRMFQVMFLWRTDDDAHGAAGARIVRHSVARQQLAAVVARRVLEALIVGDALLAGLRGPCRSVTGRAFKA